MLESVIPASYNMMRFFRSLFSFFDSSNSKEQEPPISLTNVFSCCVVVEQLTFFTKCLLFNLSDLLGLLSAELRLSPDFEISTFLRGFSRLSAEFLECLRPSPDLETSTFLPLSEISSSCGICVSAVFSPTSLAFRLVILSINGSCSVEVFARTCGVLLLPSHYLFLSHNLQLSLSRFFFVL